MEQPAGVIRGRMGRNVRFEVMALASADNCARIPSPKMTFPNFICLCSFIF